MSNIFLEIPNKNKIIKYLKINSNIINNKYIIDNNNYKTSLYHNNIINFINYLKPYYNKSKIFYLERKMNYKNYLTIIRQICNVLNIYFKIKKKYVNSTYEIFYIIYISHDTLSNVPNKLSTLNDLSFDNLENQL